MTENIHPIFDQLVSRGEKEDFLNQRAKLIWFTGLSGSGKSTIAKGLEKELFKRGFYVQVLDGDNIRMGISNNLDFSEEDRRENIRRIAEVAKFFPVVGIPADSTYSAFKRIFKQCISLQLQRRIGKTFLKMTR